MGLLWEALQTKTILDTKNEMHSRARAVESHTRDFRRDLEQMEQKIGLLSLICRSMWTFIQENHDISEKDLIDRIKEVDLMDGTADGQVHYRKVHLCRNCKRVINKKSNSCYYCGEEGSAETIFESL